MRAARLSGTTSKRRSWRLARPWACAERY
jgi:hypothetical protein